MKRLLSYDFQFVQKIEPISDPDGRIIEYSPQSYFESKETHGLNAYGDGPFCKFKISSFEWAGTSGVYAFFSDEELIYVGQAVDFARRINQGYGNISPRNCYIGGQETNCRINQALLQEMRNEHIIKLYFYTTPNYNRVESELINYFGPKLNISKNPDLYRTTKQTKPLNQSQNNKYSKIRSGTPGNPNMDSIRDFIQRQIIKAKERGCHELVLQSGEIHKALSMKNGMPSVCRAMHTLTPPRDYVVIRQSPSGFSSKLIIKYLF